ncbi:MAG: hypothetical protein AAF587_14115 [Bacteroidota bacterium]
MNAYFSNNSLRMIWVFAALLLVGGRSFSQTPLSEIDARNFLEAATSKVEQFGSNLSLLGRSDITAEDKDKIIKYAIYSDIVLDQETHFSNDLDPTGKALKELPIESYLFNVKAGYFPPQKGGVKIIYQSISSTDAVYYTQDKDQYFVKVVVERYLEGSFVLDDHEEYVRNTDTLDFYVKVVEEGSAVFPPSIYSMSFHEDNAHTFTKAKVVAGQKRLLSAEEQAKMEADLFRVNRELQLIKERLASSEREARIQKEKRRQAEEKIRQEKRARELAESEARQAKIQKDIAIQREGQAKREEALAEKEAYVQRLRNRVSLKLGAGTSIFLGNNYHRNPNDPTINTLQALGSVWWRIGRLRNMDRAQSGFSLVGFFRGGYLDTYTLSQIVGNQNSINFSETASFQDFEGGFAISQYMRISAGTGNFSYKDAWNNQVSQKYYSATLGFYTPALGNVALTGYTLTAMSTDNPWKDGRFRSIETLHLSINAYVIFQIQ